MSSVHNKKKHALIKNELNDSK